MGTLKHFLVLGILCLLRLSEGADDYEEGSADGDPCWIEGQCHPFSRHVDSVDCNHCPNQNPATWREQDVELGVNCKKDSATITFNLDNLNDVGWLDRLSVMITYTNKTKEENIILPDFYMYEMAIPDLKSGSKYNFCLKFMADSDGGFEEVAHFCKSCAPSQFYDDDMCGRVDINLREPPPIPEFSCPANKPIEPQEDKGLHEEWPWMGQIVDRRTGSTKIVTDASLAPSMTDAEAEFEFSLGFHDPEFISPLLSSRLDSSNVLVVTLAEKIPPSIFRPVCVPPKNYINKMVKSKSCKERREQKITQVTLVGGRLDKAQYGVIDENGCSLSLLNSRTCTQSFPSLYSSSDTMQRDSKYIEGHFNKKKGPEGLITDIEPEHENFYRCHVGAVTAAANCKLPEIRSEAKCQYVEDDSCVGFVSKQLRNKKAKNKNEENLKDCAKEVEEDYSGCIVQSYFETSVSQTKKKDNRPFKGVNCLHDYIEMPTCAIDAGTGKEKPLGNNWIFDPCRTSSIKTRAAYDRCRDKNQYFTTTKPFWTYWSKSMVNGVQKFSENINEELQCSQCGNGPNKCTRGGSPPADGSQAFLFWFDSCRDKWFFLGPSISSPLREDLPNCEVPSVHANLESKTTAMRRAVEGKVKEILLYPKPVVVVLGPTGVGKSTTGNALLSGNKDFSSCFSTGSGTNSKTKVTDWKVGKWLGVGSCMTVVDTPGTDDTSGQQQDYENIKELTKFLKEDLKEIDIFLVMFKEQNMRFVPSMKKAIKLFESIFGADLFWSNVATEFTFWGFSESAMKDRYKNRCSETDLTCPTTFGQVSTTVRTTTDNWVNIDEDDWRFGDDYDRKKRQLGGEDGMACSLMTSDPITNREFFEKQDLDTDAWNTLVPYDNFEGNGERFKARVCAKDEWESSPKDIYEKADFISRYMKQDDWNEEYALEKDHNIPYVFIHPVWDTKSDLECGRFQRETSRLWEVANAMTPFRCTSICQAPDDIFLGTPQILEYLNVPEISIPFKETGTFTLTCTLWNGVGLAGVSGDDIKWFQGWDEVDLSDRFTKGVKVHEREADKTVLTLRFRPRMTDIGLYDCVLPGLKDQSSLSYSTSQILSLETYADKKGGEHKLTCFFDVNKAEFESRGYGTKIKLFFAKEIEKGIPNLDHFTKSTTKNSAQYSVSRLTFDFKKNQPEQFEGKFGCKRIGKAGYSNTVDITVKVDAAWAEWTRWGVCSKTCLAQGDPNPGTQRRTRECQPAKNGGLECSDLTGSYHEDQSCNLNCCPKDGQWMEWSQYGHCTKSCSNEGEEPGRWSRTRSCQPPQCGGKNCDEVEGPGGKGLVDSGECKGFETEPCPIPGNWGEWGEWSDCIAADDPCHGKNVKTRECNNPAPQYGGAECSGPSSKEKFCDIVDCPIDCACNDFNDVWSSCSQSCTPLGGSPGIQTSERVCVEGANGGKTCKQKYEVELNEPLTRNSTCNTNCCPVDGFFSQWSRWDTCDKKTGTKKRRRSCNPPHCGGRPCAGHTEEFGNCNVDCDCTGVEWSSWSSCSSECPTCSRACGTGEKKQTRVCKISINGGRRCDDTDQVKMESCEHEKRCALTIAGIWNQWGKWSDCSVKCGGGFREKTRECTYPELERMKTWDEPYDNDYDSKMPCVGEGIATEGKDEGTDKCNAKSCELSTLVFLMDTTASFSGTDQNSALDLANGILQGLKKEKVIVPSYRLITVNDPDTEVSERVNSLKEFKATLRSLYSKDHYYGGDWPEQSLDAILKGLKVGSHGEVFCLFTDAATHKLELEAEILRRKAEFDIPVFVFITPDYNININNEARLSFRAYQRITRRHTYIMSQIDPSSLVTVIKKYLKSSKTGCLTYAGPTETVTWKGESITRKWADGPQECQFPFWHNGVEFTSCTTEGGISQPWCATAVKKNATTKKPDMVEGMWGYCGDCSGTTPAECQPGGHTVLTDSWRSIKGGKRITSADDHDLEQKWYRFKVEGTSNMLPAFKRGDTTPHTCAGGAKYGSVELQSYGSLDEAVPHDKGILEQRICFDPFCNDFRRVEVLWCRPDPVGGVQGKGNKPFHIYKLKPLAKLGTGFGYCVQ